jgi:ABC-type multidrug transport system permease subunit
LLWGVPFRGSVLAVCLLVVIGGMCFCGLGILIAARPRTVEGVGGLMNLVLLPMWLLGGSFFDNERVTGVLRWAVEAMPLTHLNRGLRDCMLGGGGFEAARLPLAVLAVLMAVCFLLALRLFRWT